MHNRSCEHYSTVRCSDNKALILLLSCLSCFFILSSCTDNIKNRPLPVNGVIDLRDWDFRGDGSVSLTGYWEFYYGGFLSAQQFDSLPEKNYAWVPGVWKRKYYPGNEFDTLRENRSHWWPQLPWEKHYWKGEKLGGTGYASYRLTILFPPGQKDMTFVVRGAGTAMSFFLGDSLAVSSGTPGNSRESSVPMYRKRIVTEENLEDTARVILWVSNFHYRKGGLWKSILVGESNTIETKESDNFHFYLFLTGVWFMTIFVMLAFFLYRPGERSVMLLMLWALSALVRMVSSDDLIITLVFPGIGFEWLVKLELISLYALVLVGTNIIFQLFPEESFKWLNKSFTVLLLIPMAVSLFTPALFHSNFVVPFQLIALTVVVYSNYVLFRAILRKREGASIMGIGFAVMSVILVLQFPYYNQLTGFSVSNETAYGFLFALMEVILLARMFSSALVRVESFAGELEKTVELRTRELVDTQEQLITAARQAETEKIRQRISQDIHDDISSGLNKISWMSELVKIKARNNKTDEVFTTLDKIIRASKDAVDHMIEIIWSLNPSTDNLENMLAYMRNYINKFFEDTSFHVAVNFPEQPPRIDLNPELKRNLFLVMKEALHNAAKYSDASNITVDFRIEATGYILTIADDGTGLEEGVIRGTGQGMGNMRKRMEDVRGQFRISSEPGRGTKIVLEGPLY